MEHHDAPPPCPARPPRSPSSPDSKISAISVRTAARTAAARLAPVLLALAGAACGPPLPRPVPVQPGYVHREVAARYRAFFPPAVAAAGAEGAEQDPDQEHDQGLLRPRFGLPTIVRSGAPFAVLVLERGGAPAAAPRAALLPAGRAFTAAELLGCVEERPVPGCHPLALQVLARDAVDDGAALVTYQARQARPGPEELPAGAYDLYLSSAIDLPTRVPKAVWLRAQDPGELAAMRVAHLSDLHIGKRIRDARDIISTDPGEDLVTARLKRVVAEVNAQRPDLVVITGDIAHRGQDEALARRAQALLLQLDAPVLVVMGNHDIEFDMRRPSPRRYGAGWSNFARAFHPYLHYQIRLGGYDFVGFDSGPSERSPRVLTRGLGPATLAQLAEDLRGASGQRGVVFFSHAPTRATVFASVRPRAVGFFGRMRHGHAAFEELLLTAAQRGQRVLHLAGHTHWFDVFEAEPRQGRLAFNRWPTAVLGQCPRPIHGRAALITTQAASHAGVFFKDNARGYGFSMLTLGEGDPTVAVHRFGVAAPQAPCREPGAS